MFLPVIAMYRIREATIEESTKHNGPVNIELHQDVPPAGVEKRTS